MVQDCILLYIMSKNLLLYSMLLAKFSDLMPHGVRCIPSITTGSIPMWWELSKHKHFTYRDIWINSISIKLTHQWKWCTWNNLTIYWILHETFSPKWVLPSTNIENMGNLISEFDIPIPIEISLFKISNLKTISNPNASNPIANQHYLKCFAVIRGWDKR